MGAGAVDISSGVERDGGDSCSCAPPSVSAQMQSSRPCGTVAPWRKRKKKRKRKQSDPLTRGPGKLGETNKERTRESQRESGSERGRKTRELVTRPKQNSRFKFSAFPLLCRGAPTTEWEGTSHSFEEGKETADNTFQLLSTPTNPSRFLSPKIPPFFFFLSLFALVISLARNNPLLLELECRQEFQEAQLDNPQSQCTLTSRAAKPYKIT